MKNHPFDCLDSVLRTRNEDPFLGDSGRVLSARETRDLIDRISLLIESRVGKGGEPVAIAINLPRDSRYIASMFAIWQLGHYFVPLNVRWPQSHLEMILRKARPALVISDSSIDGVNWISVSALESIGVPAAELKFQWSEQRRKAPYAYLIFTSGSTGEQKGVLIGVPAYLSYIGWVESYFAEFRNNRALLITAELTFDITLGDIAFSLAFGTAIHVSPDPRNIFWHAKLIADRKIDTFYSVPSTILRLFGWLDGREDLDVSSLNLIVSGGDSFSPDLIKLVSRLLPASQFHNVYGPTEVTINCFASRVDNLLDLIAASSNLVPIGKPFPHLKTLLIDPETHEVGANPGELIVAGPQTMEGYFGDPLLSERAFIELAGEKFYRTGDLVSRDSAGYHFVIGRIGNLVKVRGYRINPTEIDNALKAHSDVLEVKTVTFAADESAKLIVSFVVVPAAHKDNAETLVRHCRNKLPAYMVPEEIVYLDQIPIGSSGKYDTAKLKQLYLSKVAAT